MKHGERFTQLVNEALKEVTEISAEEVKQGLEPFVLIDIREESEWQAGHIPKATYLGRGVLEVKIERLIPDVNTPLVLYCGGGNRSALSAQSLQKMGYTNVRSMAGGFRNWCAMGYEVVL